SVLSLGISTRRHMGRPQLSTGSRMVRGHRSPYRLEGSRVSFAFLNADYREALREYRYDLERVGNSVDLTRLSKNEQLAFWFNLHNVTLIQQISVNYPTRRPSRLKIDGVLLDDAKLLNIKGVSLSLRDIRERIVFANWSEKDVIYGFFRGDIGSPAMQDRAYTAKNVFATLDRQGDEFVSSLRGFNETSRNREVSRLYEEVRPYYFQNWDADLQNHLLRHASVDMKAEVMSGKPFKIDRYDDVIADLMGGDRPRIATGNMIDANSGRVNDFAIPEEVARLVQELQAKRQVLKSRGLWARGVVVIEDIETSNAPQYDPDIDPNSSLYVPPNQ
ncbi:MAG: DUF547 domain-containing protein, partial [Maricaulaceae bacterium]